MYWQSEDVLQGRTGPGTTDEAALQGPNVPSHPFEEMLAGRRPEVSHLADIVPHDFYYIRFASLTQMLHVADYAERVGDHLRSQALSQAFTSDRRAFIERQLCLPSDPESQSSLDRQVQEVVLTGSDLFWELGSDVSILFGWRGGRHGRAQLNAHLQGVMQQNADATRQNGSYHEVAFTHVSTPDRRIHFFAAHLGDGVSVRCNSRTAFEQLIDTWKSTDAKDQNCPSLSRSSDFLYMRTLLTKGAEDEDGMIFLSDAFIRRQVGPTLRIKQRRRLLCYNSLRTLQHAALMHRTQHGELAADLDALVDSGCLSSDFQTDHFGCSDGGHPALLPDGLGAMCSFHGSTAWMKPCCEVPLHRITPPEREQYAAFVELYSNFWEEYFDPIGMRIKLASDSYRLETVILPLIRNSVYEGLLDVLSGDPTQLKMIELPNRTVLGVATRLNKRRLALSITTAGTDDALIVAVEDQPTDVEQTPIREPTEAETAAAIDLAIAQQLRHLNLGGTWEEQFGFGEFLMKGLGNEIGLYVCDTRPNFRFNMPQFMARILSEGEPRSAWLGFLVSSLTAPVYVAIPIEDCQLVDDFLRRSHPWVGRLAEKKQGGFFPVEYQYSLCQIDGREVRSFGINVSGFGVRWHVLRLGDILYITPQLELARELIDAHAEASQSERRNDRLGTGHAQAWMWPANWQDSLASYQFEWAAANQKACFKNLSPLTNVARAGVAPSLDAILAEAALRDGVYYACPSGGRYIVGDDHCGLHVHCDMHGCVLDARQPPKPPEASDTGELLSELGEISATVQLTPEGLRAVFAVQRTGPPSGNGP